MRLKNGGGVWGGGGAGFSRVGRWRIFLDLQNRAPMQVKLAFSQNVRFFQFFVFSKNDVLPAWELNFRVFSCFFCVFCVFVFLGTP